MHRQIDLPIYYFGTPVVLISTINEDGSDNIAPSSSIWWLGESCVIGLDGSSKTTENLKRTGECVINLASDEMVVSVDKIANTTGSRSIPLHKKRLGYSYVKDKFLFAGLTAQKSQRVSAKRIGECKIQLEARVAEVHQISRNNSKSIIPMFSIELDIVTTHIDESILMENNPRYVDPEKWHPLIMKFREFYTTREYIHPSRLSKPSVENYRQRELKGVKGRVMKKLIKFLYRKYV